MKLKVKLLALSFSTQFLFVLILVLYFVLMSPVSEIEKEYTAFIAASNESRDLLLSMNKLYTSNIDQSMENFVKDVDGFNKAVSIVANLDKIPGINSLMAESVSTVGALGNLADQPIVEILEGFSALVEALHIMDQDTSSLNIPSILLLRSNGIISEEEDAVLQYHTNTLLYEMETSDQVLMTMINVIEERQAIVTSEIQKMKTRNMNITIILFIIFFGIVVFFSLFLASSISKSILVICNSVKIIADGNLTPVFGLTRKDEIGLLGKDLDTLLENMNNSIGKIMDASKDNALMRDRFMDIATESGSSAIEIKANTQSIENQMIRMDGMIDKTLSDTNSNMQIIRSFSERVVSQNTHINESVSAITQMLSSIENINRITTYNRMAAADLVTESDRGREVFGSAFEKIAQMTESIDSIKEMADVIAGIANQTNILAMNAAIEAAHAGEYGKGFAVVADEIGKLASASAESSSDIAQTISLIVELIRETSSTRDTTFDAFNKISSQIQQVSDSTNEIHSNIDEVQSGSKMIITAMESLRTSSGSITSESAEIDQKTQEVGKTMNDIGRVSGEITFNIKEITTGIEMITDKVSEIKNYAEQMSYVGHDLDTAVSVFKTRS